MPMIKEIGSKDFPIWLLGDSNPENWTSDLETPLDPRHPARHSIWTPILEVIQDKVYRRARLRVDTANIYIRNAIENPQDKPFSNSISWPTSVLKEINEMRSSVACFKPVFIFCFGQFAYEFGRRISGESPEYAHGHWGARKLGEEFRNRIKHFECGHMNTFPLLHVSIARGKFMQSHEYFCNYMGSNYFEFVGNHLADILLTHQARLNIWIA